MAKLRKLDDLSRVVIPLELSESLGWGKRQEVRIEVDKAQNALVITAGKAHCCSCDAQEDLKKLPTGKSICQACLSAVQ